MSDSNFDGNAFVFTLANNDSVDVEALHFLSISATTATIEVAKKGGNTYLPFGLRQVFGDLSGPLGTMKLRNSSGSPVTFTVITSTRGITWSDTAVAVGVTITGSTATVATSATQLPASLGQKVMTASLPVVIASDQSPIISNPTSATKTRFLTAATTNGAVTKAAAGKLFGYVAENRTAGTKFLKFYDKATAPTVGTDTPALSVTVPANSTIFFSIEVGIAFTLGIGHGLTGAVGDADVTVTAVGDVAVTYFWI